jgi:hypothetical protein
MTRNIDRKIAPFLGIDRKIEFEKGAVLIFCNDFINLPQFSATFRALLKIQHRPIFRFSSAIYSRENQKVVSDLCHEHVPEGVK